MTIDSTLKVGATTSYLTCRRCGLSIEIALWRIGLTRCPGCVAFARTCVEVFGARLSANTLFANTSLHRPDDGSRPW